MIALFTDFGAASPYVGQLHAVLRRAWPEGTVIDLCHELEPFEPRGAAYLLRAWAPPFGPETVFLAVVDPEVGGDRPPLIVEADDQWFVGPGNGLMEMIWRQAARPRAWAITWRPKTLSASFHGRDLFAPMAAKLATGWRPDASDGDTLPLEKEEFRRPNWPDELDTVIYFDRFGNAMTGRRANSLPEGAELTVKGTILTRGRTFVDRSDGAPFWYENSSGLVEIAAAKADATALLDLHYGDPVEIRL